MNRYELLKRMENRLHVFISISLHTLRGIHTFLSGYKLGLLVNDIPDTDKFMRFSDWIAKKLKFYNSTMNWWPDMILASTIGMDPNQVNWTIFSENYSSVTEEQHAKSIKRFYELLEEFYQ